jgi:hypothetical protein
MTTTVRTRLVVGILSALGLAVAGLAGHVLLTGKTATAATPPSFGGVGPVWAGGQVTLAGMTIGAPPVGMHLAATAAAATDSAASAAAQKAWPVPGSHIQNVKLALVSGGPYATPQLAWVVMYAPGEAPYQVNPISGTPVVTAWVFVDAADGSVFTMFASTEPQPVATGSSPAPSGNPTSTAPVSPPPEAASPSPSPSAP